ncbi:LON peptidase N-terminal domain and RING finger protein 2 [Dendropsophus ebraccatus]|uniref:LON peptidase N-terminal domain and RING finger protein 2 n=1 Tax=Dendropsophus ebraccatus TaxID=150705 RepID=UPI003831CB2E
MEVRALQPPEPFSLDPPGLCSEMLGVAEEAFKAGNFDLAAEIYGSQLDELPQPERSLYLKKGDALALAGRVADALASYTRAAMLRQLCPQELGILVESIAHTIREKELKLPCAKMKSDAIPTKKEGKEPHCTRSTPPEQPLGSDLFSCPMCRLLLLDPVTLTCGHCFCKKCLCDRESTECSCCSNRIKGKAEGHEAPGMDLKVNVVLGNLMEKWFGAETKVRRLSAEGDALWQNKDLVGALEKYNAALELAPRDPLLTMQRAQLYSAMKNFKQSLSDADTICRKQPLWAKGHCVKAQALSGLGRMEESLKEFLYCVSLNPEWSLVKAEAQKLMCEMLFPAFENVQASFTARAATPYTRLKPVSLNGPNSSHSVDDASLPGGSKDPAFRLTKASFSKLDMFQMKNVLDCPDICDLPDEKATKTLGSVLSCLPGVGLKRKRASTSEDANSIELPAKVIRNDAESKWEEPTSPLAVREIPKDLVDSSDFECSLCMRLFYEPVATPCGHTFCLKCLERCLDHNPHCPLCKENLSQYLASRAYKKTFLTEELIIRYLPEELSERKKLYDEEMKELSNLSKDVPIFVCTMAFPTIPCPLHVFEPRYRLMIRRSIETGTKQFGMCIADELKGFADYGCMLQVRDVKFFPDGRSVVDTIGLSRFKVLSHGQRDGYNTANIEYLEDKKVEGQEYEELLQLHNSVYDQALAWFSSLKDNLRTQILNHFGSMPSKDSDPQSNPSGPAWCWWMLAVLPLENKAQLTILAMTSLKDRLQAIRRVLFFVTRKRPR